MSMPMGLKRQWYLYYMQGGVIQLCYPDWGSKYPIPCPYCGEKLNFENYTAECCYKTFKTSWYKCRQVEPYGTHKRRYTKYVPLVEVLRKTPLY